VNQYRGWDPNLAVQDYYSRIRDHEKHYETVDELDVPSIRIMNVCSQSSLYGMSPQLTTIRSERRSWSMYVHIIKLFPSPLADVGDTRMFEATYR
jgi:hypothetical protein